MSRFVEFPLESGGSITVEVDEEIVEHDVKRAGASERMVQAGETFERALEKLKPTAAALMSTLRELGPEEIGVEFGFTMSTDAGVIIAKAGTKANFKVTIKWNRAK